MFSLMLWRVDQYTIPKESSLNIMMNLKTRIMFENYMISKIHKSKEIFSKHKQSTGETLMTFRKKPCTVQIEDGVRG